MWLNIIEDAATSEEHCTTIRGSREEYEILADWLATEAESLPIFSSLNFSAAPIDASLC